MSKPGYSLIAIGLILLAYNYSLIDFSLLSKPLALPIILIIAGIFSIIKSLIKQNDFIDILSSIIGLVLFLAIILNIFSFPLMIIPINSNAIVLIDNSSLTASFASLNFSSMIKTAVVNYESGEKNYLESSTYEADYKIINSFTDSNYDFKDFYAKNLDFENNFGDSTIINLAFVDNSTIKNSFGELTIMTGDIYGEKILRASNAFGSLKIIIDAGTSYKISSSNSFGSIKNNIGLLSNDYSSAKNKIDIIIDNSFGSVEISRQ
jgi:hypothetical protein